MQNKTVNLFYGVYFTLTSNRTHILWCMFYINTQSHTFTSNRTQSCTTFMAYILHLHPIACIYIQSYTYFMVYTLPLHSIVRIYIHPIGHNLAHNLWRKLFIYTQPYTYFMAYTFHLHPVIHVSYGIYFALTSNRVRLHPIGHNLAYNLWRKLFIHT